MPTGRRQTVGYLQSVIEYLDSGLPCVADLRVSRQRLCRFTRSRIVGFSSVWSRCFSIDSFVFAPAWERLILRLRNSSGTKCCLLEFLLFWQTKPTKMNSNALFYFRNSITLKVSLLFSGGRLFVSLSVFLFFFLVLLWSGEQWSCRVCQSKPPHSVIRLGWITVTCFSFFSRVFCCCVSWGISVNIFFGHILRTFAPKFSNIDFFLNILPLKDDELVMSEM